MTGTGLRPSSRLTSARQYDAVFAKPKRQSDRLFTILSRVNDKPYGRLGIFYCAFEPQAELKYLTL